MIKTKIVATIGPTSREPEMLEKLVRAGIDVARLNMSHGNHEYHLETIQRVRAVSKKVGKPIAILVDLQGPKIRVADMGLAGIMLHDNEPITLTVRPVEAVRTDDTPESKALIPVQYEYLAQDVRINEPVLLDDGLLELQVTQVLSNTDVRCQVIVGGILKSNKGLNLPGSKLSIPAISPKDWQDCDFAIMHKADWIALSFVRRPEEVEELKAYIDLNWEGPRPARVISKIEKPEALENMEAIVRASNGIMVARGDLGIEIPTERVPLAQKQLIRESNRQGKPVITATQMLDSMIRNPRPTRAEASDVANAILDGTDAIMLSGETASGDYPVEAVETMRRIAAEVESMLLGQPWSPPPAVGYAISDVTDAVSLATCQSAEGLHAKAILTATATGHTSRAVARYRPHVPIIAVTPNETVQRQLMLSWGVIPLIADRAELTERVLANAVKAALLGGYVAPGDKVVITSGVASNVPGMTNLMLIEQVGQRSGIDLPSSRHGVTTELSTASIGNPEG